MINVLTNTITRFAALCIVGSRLAIGASTSASAAMKTFNKPKISGDRLDWCFNWAQGRGEQAADAFCQKKGFAKSTFHKIDHDIGSSTSTRLISTGAVCDMNFCDGFKKISCSN